MGELMLFISWVVREEGERAKKYLVIKKGKFMYVEMMITEAGEREVGKYEQFLIAASGRCHHRPGP